MQKCLHTIQADEAFMRVGDKSRKLNFDERMQLMYDKGERNYKDEAAYGATIDDVDMAAVNEYTKSSATESRRWNISFRTMTS